MRCLTVNNCCCCFSLETGGLFMGWIGAIIYGLGVIGFSLAFFADYSNEADLTFLYVSLSINLLISLGMCIVCILLIRGTNKRDSSLMVPWLIIQGVAVLLLIVSASLQLFVSLWSGIGSFLVVLFWLYLWSCIYSLYLSVRG